MRKPNSILPIHPAPEAADILSRESLSGYCIRLASNNHLNIEALLAELSAQGARLSHSTSKQRQFRNLDLSPQSLQPLATVSNQSIEQLFKLSATSLYEAFYGQPHPGSTGVQLFFLLPYSQRSFVTIRRYCPLCLTERLLYPLLWQFSEITICTRHGCRLEERCPGCGHTIPLLRTGSVLGRCCHCLKQLTKSHPRWASTRDVEHQMGLNDDYELLLSGSIHFREGSQTPGSPMSWSTKLHYLRTHNDLSIKEVARHLHISPSTVLAIEKGNQLITFGILARMIRFYAGSFKKFSDVKYRKGGFQIPPGLPSSYVQIRGACNTAGQLLPCWVGHISCVGIAPAVSHGEKELSSTDFLSTHLSIDYLALSGCSTRISHHLRRMTSLSFQAGEDHRY